MVKLMKNRTILIIARRLSTIRDGDKIAADSPLLFVAILVTTVFSYLIG